ncbi:hypothetical protein [Streptomyces erythrochromogenes]|uniref:hypothetical protein n=1 Tax=Streptomyces erythrochromogenes TaxID=285574 RepID=UPI0036CA030A
MIPAGRDQPSYPRFFVVFSKANGWENGPSTAVHHFQQEAPGGEWKAAVETWVAMEAPVPLESTSVTRFAWTTVQLRPTDSGGRCRARRDRCGRARRRRRTGR